MIKRKEEIAKRLGVKIKEARLAKELSHVQLANEADIAVSQIWRIEAGKINITVVTLLAIAEALKVPVIDLLEIDLSKKGK